MVLWNIRLLGVKRGGRFTKNHIEEEGLAKGEGAWTVCRFKGGLARKKGVLFWGGGEVDTPMHISHYSRTDLVPVTLLVSLLNSTLLTDKPCKFTLMWQPKLLPTIHEYFKKKT